MGCHRSKPTEVAKEEPPPEEILGRLKKQHAFLTEMIIKHANLGHRTITSQLSVRRGEILEHIRSLEQPMLLDQVKKASEQTRAAQTPTETQSQSVPK